jgi:hypothetical protein
VAIRSGVIGDYVSGYGGEPGSALQPNVFGSPPMVILTGATSGAVIYDTTDGTTPRTSSTLYTGPITGTKTEVIEAIGVAKAI